MRPTARAAISAGMVLVVVAVVGVTPMAVAGRQGPARSAPPTLATPEPPRWISVTAVDVGKTVYLRQRFRLREFPRSATLAFASRGGVAVYLNGREVFRSSDPVAGQQAYVTRALVKGTNVLAASVRSRVPGPLFAFELLSRPDQGPEVRVISNGDERYTSRPGSGWAGPLLDDAVWQVVKTGAAWTRSVASPTGSSPAVTPTSARLPDSVLDFGWVVRLWHSPARTGPDSDSDRMSLVCLSPQASQLPVIAAAGFDMLAGLVPPIGPASTSGSGSSSPPLEAKLARDYGFGLGATALVGTPLRSYRQQYGLPLARCVEHDQPGDSVSLWDPKLSAYATRVLAWARTQVGSPAGRLRHLLVQGPGDNGEMAVPSGLRSGAVGSVSHGHVGWWCGDSAARAQFRESALRRYGGLDGVNRAWRTSAKTTDELSLPASPASSTRAHWLDFAEWYASGSAAVADSVCRAAARVVPGVRLVIPVGSDSLDPRIGSDVTLLASIAGRHGADVQVNVNTQLSFGEAWASGIGLAVAAARQSKSRVWLAGLSDRPGAASVAAAASLAGVSGIAANADHVLTSREAYYRAGRTLRAGQRVVDVAMFCATTSARLRADGTGLPLFRSGCSRIRDIMDYDVVDERLVDSGALEKYRLLVMWEGTVVPADTLARIRSWVQAGGTLVAYDFGKVEDQTGDLGWFRDVFGYAGRLRPVPSAAPAGPAGGSFTDTARLRSEWAKPYGRGWTVYYPARKSAIDGFIEVIRYLTYHMSEMDPAKIDAVPVDDAWDGVYASLFPDRIVYHNSTQATVPRTIVLSQAALTAHPVLSIPRDLTSELTIEPGAIVSVPLATPPMEALLQCEKFTERGTLEPLPGAAFSPGVGLTHVLVPTGGSITTYFECPADGTYRLFYRATRRGAPARMQVSIDGRRGAPAAANGTAHPGARTTPAGAWPLRKGIHALVVRPLPGEDVRADFVVVTNDRGIAGYGFAARVGAP